MAKKSKTETKEVKKVPVKVGLVNRKNYPITFNYDGEDFVLPPKGRTKKEFTRANLNNIDPKELTIF